MCGVGALARQSSCKSDIPFDRLRAGFVPRLCGYNSCGSDTLVRPTFPRLQRLRLVPKLLHRLILPLSSNRSNPVGCTTLVAHFATEPALSGVEGGDFDFRRNRHGSGSLVSSQLLIQLRQRCFQHLPMPGIARHLQLLQNPLPRKLESLPLLPCSDLLRSQNFAVFLLRRRLVLLLLNRLAFPSACHFGLPDATKRI